MAFLDRESKLFHISSDDAQPGSPSTSNFTTSMGNVGIQRIVRLVLKSVSFPNVFYNVRTGQTDTLRLQENGHPAVNVIINQGYWNVIDLMAALQTSINALMVTAVATVTQDPQTFKINIAFAGNTVAVLAADPQSTMAPLLGFSVSSGQVSSYTAANIPNLIGLTEVFISSLQLTPGNMLQADGNQKPIVMNIPITVPFGALNTYQSFDDELNSINFPSPKDIRFIDIQLQDRSGNVVNLQNQNLKILFKAYV